MSTPNIESAVASMLFELTMDRFEDSSGRKGKAEGSSGGASMDVSVEVEGGTVNFELSTNSDGQVTGDVSVDNGGSTESVEFTNGEISGGSGGDGVSIFEVIAKALGKQMSEALGNMESLSGQIGSAEGPELAQLTSELTAQSQKFQLLSQTFNTTINALGQGASTAARKQ